MTEKDLLQAEYFKNRLAKNERHLRKWARREGIQAYRLYDNDIPEVPLCAELYRQTRRLDSKDPLPEDCLVLSLYERPYEKDPEEESAWLKLMADAAAEALAIRRDLVFPRLRRRQRGQAQYERLGPERDERLIEEGGLSFIVDFGEHLDTGLFLDHRPTRALVRTASSGKRVLNLFSYTGSFSVYAAAGGAAQVTSVDLSKTYLGWASRNLAVNGFEGPRFPLERAEVRRYLSEAEERGSRWDLIVCDPPTFSNSSASDADFDINREWPTLVAACLALLAPDGTLVFSTNSRKLKWDDSRVAGRVEDLSESCLPPDFRDRRIRRTWRVSRLS